MAFDRASWRAVCSELHAGAASLNLYFLAAANADRAARGAVPPMKVYLEETLADAFGRLSRALEILSRPPRGG